MWFKFKEDSSIGMLQVKQAQVCYYDMDRDGICFDETIFAPSKMFTTSILEKLGKLLPYTRTVTTIGEKDVEKHTTGSRVFVHMEDGNVYELLTKKLSKEEFEKCNNYYGK